MKKLALALCLAMILSILPASALAADLDSFAAAAEEILPHLDEPFQNALASNDPEELYASAQEYYERFTARGMMDQYYGDALRAHQLYLKAAELGFAKAQFAVARDYSGSLSYPIDRDDGETFRWALKAAEQGYLTAYPPVINCYRNGTGTEQSEDSAKQWEEKLADDTAQLLKEVSSPDCSDPGKLQMAAECCQRGRGTDKDMDKALEYYQRAAEAGSDYCAATLGNLYRQTYDIEKNIAKSIEWYTKACEMGNKPAGISLASIYLYGADQNGTEKNPEKAAAILQVLAEKGYVPAQTQLADLFMSGEGVPWDSAKAFEWYLKAAAQDDAYAQCELGDIFTYGLSDSDYNPLIAENRDLAKAFLTRASENGYPRAADLLANLG